MIRHDRHITSRSRARSQRHMAGFSLTEVLLAIGIFAIGIVAVASIFPVAILLQKATMESIEADIFANSAESLLMARGFDGNTLNADCGDNPITHPTDPNQKQIFASMNALDDWAMADRSYGSIDPVSERDIFWVPLFYDNDESTGAANREWFVYLFVVKAATNGTYDKSSGTWANDGDGNAIPGVAQVSVTASGSNLTFTNTTSDGYRAVRIGDKVVDNNGVTYKVTDADAGSVTIDGVAADAGSVTHIWYAHPGDQDQSSFVDLKILVDDDSSNSLVY